MQLEGILNRLRLIKIALLKRGSGMWESVGDLWCPRGRFYDVRGNVESFAFARAILGRDAVPPEPEFANRLGPSSLFTPEGYPAFYNSEPSVSSFLGQLVAFKKPSVVVELGCFVGFTSAHLAVGLKRNQSGHLYCVDIGEKEAEIARSNMKRLGLADRVTVLVGGSLDQKITAALPDRIDILFIDTSHLYPDTLHEIRFYAQRVFPGGCIALHDSTSFPGVRRSIEEILPEFRVHTFATDAGNGLTILIDPGDIR